MNEAPAKLKVMRNQYCELVMYSILVVTAAKLLATLTVNSWLQIEQPSVKIAVGIKDNATP